MVIVLGMLPVVLIASCFSWPAFIDLAQWARLRSRALLSL